jgi:hypothetical protein
MTNGWGESLILKILEGYLGERFGVYAGGGEKIRDGEV